MSAVGHSRHSRHPGLSGSPPRADIRPMPAFMSARTRPTACILVGKLDVQVREAIGEKFPKHPCLQSSKFEFIINAQHARPRSAADAARSSRRADRVVVQLAASAHSRCWHEAAVRKCPLLRRLWGLSGQRRRPLPFSIQRLAD
jgi:hypothetical protein